MMEAGTGSVAASLLPAPVRAALWVGVASVGFAALNISIRHISEADGMHPFEIAFFRNLFGLAFMLPWLARSGFAGLRTGRIHIYALRGFFSILAMLAWFWSITQMPLAEAVALSFTVPVFGTVLAWLVLRERVGPRRWTATATGFAGAMIILRPGLVEPSVPALVVLASAAFIAMAITTMKVLSRTEPSSAIVTWMVIFLTPLSLLAALPFWTAPAPETWIWLVGMGGVATFAHVCFTRGLSLADASAILPFDFARLPFVAVFAWLLFAEVPDGWTWAGAGVIFAATFYIARRELRLSRRPTPALDPGTR